MKALERISSIIIDDEPISADMLNLLLTEHFPEIQVLKVCLGPKEGLQAIKELLPKLIFLDIEMPFMSGFELLDLAVEGEYHVIFTTAHSEHALQAIKLSAVDYLLKPITTSDVKEALRNYHKRIGNLKFNTKILMEQLEAVKSNNVNKIALSTTDGLTFVYIDDIIYFQSYDVYTFCFLNDGKKLFVNKTMKTVEEILEALPVFYRIHRSYIINKNKINKLLKSDGGSIVMENGEHIPIARSKKNEFLNWINVN